MKTVDVPTRRWYDNTMRTLVFPDSFDVTHIKPKGHSKSGLTDKNIIDLINTPLNGSNLFNIAKGHSEAVIVFDDMTRPTPVFRIIPHLIETLNKAGISDNHIRLIWALGTHGTYDLTQARKKLGKDIVKRIRIFNHDAFQNNNCIKAGVTSSGIEVFLNKEFMECDLKIGIESILPHVQAGWSGGGKIVVPGISSLETINKFHRSQFEKISETGFAKYAHNPMVQIFNEAADLCSLDYKIDCFINEKGDVTDIFSGKPKDTYLKGIKKAPDHYGVESSGLKYDVVIANSYAKASEAAISFFLAGEAVKKDGTIILLFDIPEGQVYHYLFGSFGSKYGGQLFKPKEKGGTKSVCRKLIFNMKYPDENSCDMICHREDCEIIEKWDDIIKLIESTHGRNSSVAVINDGTMQYFRK